ncbi:MAG: helix-turn-helix transcriptional regulator [Burkholderiales bacterium]|nr:helix-turn-helix transcriptional regulator [Burkholderiales bacterium]
MEPDQAFGQALRSLRTKRKWSQITLALRADLDRNYLSLVELGRSSPTLRTVFRLCEALDVDPSDLMKDVARRMRMQQRPEADGEEG